MEVPPNSLDKEEVNTNNDLGWRARGGDGGRKDLASSTSAGASSLEPVVVTLRGTP